MPSSRQAKRSDDKPVASFCLKCQREFDLSDMHFVNQDYAPMVLGCQIKGRATRNKAIKYLIEKHDAYDEAEVELDNLQYYPGSPKLSHMEPGDEGHDLIGIPKGYWSFES